jgi:acyl-CoA thioesterase I
MASFNLEGVILFGDSVLFGTGASQRRFGCGRILRLLINSPVIIKSKNSRTSRDGLIKIKEGILDKESASHVVILFGNNDCKLIDFDKPIVDINEYKENLLGIIKELRLRHKVPIIANLQPINPALFLKNLPEIAKFMVKITPYEGQKKYSDTCEEIALSENVLLADIRYSLENSIDKVIAPDGIHPNDLGHRLIAEELLHKLEPSAKI